MLTIGPATLYHGDCNKIMPTLEKESINFIVTDPPYECSATVITRNNQKDLNSHFGDWDKFSTDWLSNAYSLLRPDSGMVIFVPATRFETLMEDCQKVGLKYVQPWFWHKCLDGNTLVYAKLNDTYARPYTLKVLSNHPPQNVQLFNGDNWVKVYNWNKTKQNACKITFRSGEEIICSEGHRWPTQRGLLETSNIQPGDVVSNSKLPENKLKIGRKIDKDSAWFIGVYLAEGSKGSNKNPQRCPKQRRILQISGHKNEKSRFNRVKKIAESFHGTARWHNDISTNGKSIHIHSHVLESIIDTYIDGDIAHKKRLNTKCWERDNEFLENVLNGYLSGDASLDGNRYRLNFCRNTGLANDLRTLCARLGYDLKLRKRTAKYNNQEYPSYNGTLVKKPTVPGIKGGRPTTKYNEVIKIEKLRKQRTLYDVTLLDEPHLFVLANGLLTHNSNPAPTMRNALQWAVEHMIYVVKGKHKLRMENRGKCHNIFKHPIPGAPRYHKTQKPIGLMVDIIKHVSDEGDIILDPFNGSASTGIGAITCGRKYIGIEQTDEYFEKSCERLRKEVGIT